MRRLRNVIATTAMLGVLVVPGQARAGDAANSSAKPLTVAVIGDVPYGEEQETAFGTLIDAINADPKVRDVIHVGDIKSGSTVCNDARFASVAAAFATFEDPLIYTPGDNEWTDCHRINNGQFDPLERLDALRGVFFAEPGEPLGRHPKQLAAQPGWPENVRWTESRVTFAAVHVIGSNNGLSPWTGIGNTAPTLQQSAEVEARTSAALTWIDAAFDDATERDLMGVVLAMQADTWAPAPGSAQQAIVERIAQRTASFDGQVLVIQGDTHVYKVDNPLGLPSFTRIVVHGETLPFEYLRLTIDPRSERLFTWARVEAR